jgi:LysM repeat protein
MKKITLVAIALLTLTAASAQKKKRSTSYYEKSADTKETTTTKEEADDNDYGSSLNLKSKRGENFLPEKGDWALGFSTDGIFEYLGNAFNGNTGNNAPTVNYAKGTENKFNGRFLGKYFTSDKSAYRVIFNLRTYGENLKYETSIKPDVVTTVPGSPAPTSTTVTDILEEDGSFNTDIAIGLGKEWRKGKTRLQGYYGADVLFYITKSSTTTTRNRKETLTETSPASRTEIDINNFNSEFKSGFGFGVGAEGFIGAEYFIFPKIAIGAQYTYGLNFMLQGKGKTNTTTFTSSFISDATPNQTTSTETKSESEQAPDSFSSRGGLTGVGIASINLTVHF